MRKLSLFSGVGGIDLAAHWAGMETVAFCEREPFPQRVLQKNFPGVPIYDDVCTLTADRLKEDGIIGDGRTIDIISAGYPCQPFSHAGKRRGKEDDRHLWPEVARILQEVRPNWFLGENVAGHITLGLDEVLTDLEGLGYTAQAFVIPAAAIYAGHRRDRVFIVGYSEHHGSHGTEIGRGANETSDNNTQRQGATSESEGASRSEGDESMAYSKSDTEGRLSIREGTENTGSACCCKDVANTKSGRWNARGAEQQGQQRELCSVGCCASCTGENVADPTSIGRQGQREFVQSSYTTESGEREASKPINVRIETKWAAQSRMGGNADELSNGLDGRGIDTLDDLIEFIHSYPQPALMGMPQYDWEPPRVATGVKDRTGRLKALGNAVDPLQIYPFMAAIKAIHDQITG